VRPNADGIPHLLPAMTRERLQRSPADSAFKVACISCARAGHVFGAGERAFARRDHSPPASSSGCHQAQAQSHLGPARIGI